MKTARNYLTLTSASLCALMFPLTGNAFISITAADFSYAQDFNTLPSAATGSALTWANNSTIAGWYQDYQGTTRNDYSFQAVPDGSGGLTSGGSSTVTGARFFNIGHADATDRAVGMKRLFSTSGAISVVFQNNSGATLTDFALGYTGEQWRQRGSAITPLHLEYQVVSSMDGLDFISSPSNWTRVGALQFDSPKSGNNLDLDGEFADNRTVIDPVVFSTNLAATEYLVIRWYQDRTDITGAATTVYHSLAVDDVSFAVVPEPSSIAVVFGAFAIGVAALRRRRS